MIYYFILSVCIRVHSCFSFIICRKISPLAKDPDKYHSHVGIIDYDGSWISAGPLKINKYYHPSSTYIDENGMTQKYQPQSVRKYTATSP